MEAETGVNDSSRSQGTPRTASNKQKLGARHWADSPLEPPEGVGLLLLDFGRVVARTVRKHISAVLSH